MKYLGNLLLILLFSLLIFTCRQSSTEKQTRNKISKTQNKKKYTKIISDSTNILLDKVEKLEVNYHVIGCACPNWIRTKDEVSINTNKKFKDFYFYIEPADKTLELPIYFDAFRHSLKIKGRFYEKEDYPQGTIEAEESMPKAKVFRYTSIEVINKRNFKPDSKIETLWLTYNQVPTSFTKWYQANYNPETEEKKYLYLEPENNKIINADTLSSRGEKFIAIEVTGQIVCENGYPKGFSPTDEIPKAEKVFRYSKIKMIYNLNGY